MAFSAVSVTLLFLFASCAAKQSCSEVQCKLLLVGDDAASNFQRIRTSEESVRMIYLNLKIGKDSYDPLQSPNEFLPYRWVWAPTISELLLSVSYDYDILSLGLLKRLVRNTEVQLEDKPSGCLAGLNSSCQDIVVARTLLGNVTARKGSGGIHSSKDVVCVAEIDRNMNFFENFIFEGDVEFRCCKVVDNRGGLNFIPECDIRVNKSNWYKAFYIVLNVLTLFMGFYSPVLLFMLPDYIFDLRNECEKEQKQQEKERVEKNDYQPLPSSQEAHETITEESTDDNEKDEKERKKYEIPVDDGSPVNISTLLHACASAKVFRHYSTKLSFNIKLAFLWFCVIPFLVNIELALSYMLKDEYLDEIWVKDTAILTGGLFIILHMTQTGNRIVFITSYFIIPLLIIMIMTPKDLSEERNRERFSLADGKMVKVELGTLFIGGEVLQHLKKSKNVLLKILSLGKVPIRVYPAVQNSFDDCKRAGAGRCVRFWGVLLALICSICAVICSVMVAAICLLLILFLSALVIVGMSPYFMILWFFRHKLIRKSGLIIFILSIILLAEFFMLLFPQGSHLLFPFNPLLWFLFTISSPLFLSFSSSRFFIKMCGYTIMGLIYNAEIAAPSAVFFATLASYLRDRYVDSKNKCKRVKEIISQEWQQGIKDAIDTGKLSEQEKPKVAKDAIPKKLFWYVCDGDEYQEFPLEKEALRLLRDVAIIFFIAFLAICAIFFSANSY